MARYGLVVDLSVCTGCMTCVLACKQENLTRPGIHWTENAGAGETRPSIRSPT